MRKRMNGWVLVMGKDNDILARDGEDRRGRERPLLHATRKEARDRRRRYEKVRKATLVIE